MKSVAVFPKSRQVQLVDQDAPRSTDPRHVEVRVLDVGICGTDKEIVSFHCGTPPEGSEYLVPGHECLGEVVAGGECGRAAKSWGSRRSDGASTLFATQLSSLSRWPDAVRSLVTGRFPIDAYDDLLELGRAGIKNVLSIGQSPESSDV